MDLFFELYLVRCKQFFDEVGFKFSVYPASGFKNKVAMNKGSDSS